MSSPLPGLDSTRRLLLHFYQTRVDPLFEVLHWPTAIAAIERQYTNAGGKAYSSVRALESVIYFLAVCSMTYEETGMLLSADRTALLEQYRLDAEMSISRAKLLQSPDMIVLQAFVIYLVSRAPKFHAWEQPEGTSALLSMIVHRHVFAFHRLCETLASSSPGFHRACVLHMNGLTFDNRWDCTPVESTQHLGLSFR